MLTKLLIKPEAAQTPPVLPVRHWHATRTGNGIAGPTVVVGRQTGVDSFR